MHPTSPLPRLLALATLLLPLAPSAHAETVAEWKFDSEPTDSIVKLDRCREGASDESRLSDNARVTTAPTDITPKWQPFLATGYLEAQPGGGIPSTGITEINKYGLFTQSSSDGSRKGSYAAYFGFSGFGNGTQPDGTTLNGGTVYLILSPLDAFKKGARYGFVGSGHTGEGEIQLGIDKNGDITFRAGGKSVGNAGARATIDWTPGTWYFIAASWRTQSEPVLYIRELSPSGPAASPEAILGTAQGLSPEASSPDSGPLVLGAQWFNPGNNPSTVYGAGSRIAYARFDNTYSTKEDIEATFKSLATP